MEMLLVSFLMNKLCYGDRIVCESTLTYAACCLPLTEIRAEERHQPSPTVKANGQKDERTLGPGHWSAACPKSGRVVSQ